MRLLISATLLAFVCAAVVLATGCTDAGIGQIRSLGNKHKIELYSGGKCVRTWISTGVVVNETDSDGFCFVDSATLETISISGDVVITMIK